MPLSITIEPQEFYDERTSRFFEIPRKTIQLEHSLLSISKWESKWHKPYFTDKPKTKEEELDYIRCMTISGPCDPIYYQGLLTKNRKEIFDYISDPMTATTVKNGQPNKKSREMITSELIYYWMTALNIPFSCEKWHINRLFMLIEIASIKNAPSKKMSKSDIMRQNHALNMARRAKHGTKG